MKAFSPRLGSRFGAAGKGSACCFPVTRVAMLQGHECMFSFKGWLPFPAL